MNVVHLTASPFFGGPERQMLGLARHLPRAYRSTFLCFAERGLSRPFQQQLCAYGIETIELTHNVPHYLAAAREVAMHLRRLRADVLCCHGYKPDLLGYLAARAAGVPVVAVSRGWTWATAKVRLNEWADRRVLRLVDRVVCVSQGQAEKVKRAGVPADRVNVIRNAIETGRFDHPDPAGRGVLEGFFAEVPRRIVCAVGRLSPEKGFNHLIDAARQVVDREPSVGFVVLGDGPLRDSLAGQIARLNLQGRVVLAGFRDDLDRLVPQSDLLVQSSLTEGLPNVVLEAFAGAVPVVATDVGGTGEVVEETLSGYLVPPGDAAALARRIVDALGSETRRRAMGQRARRRVEEDFTFVAQSLRYQRLWGDLVGKTPRRSLAGAVAALIWGMSGRSVPADAPGPAGKAQEHGS